MKLICDSGSTKSAWCLIDGNNKTYFSTQGINPYQQTEQQISNILKDELKYQIAVPLSNIEEVYFYGAGCNKEKAPIVEACIRKHIAHNANIIVDSDMLGAAIALCGNKSGIVCILGTGSNSAYYDGKELKNYIPALGYILGDEGSGAYIGKRLVGDILKCQFSESVRDMFFKEMKEDQASIIQKTYREPMANRYLASMSTFCARHRENAEIHAFIVDCFSEFFRRNIVPMCKMIDNDTKTINCVGSIAFYYKNEIEEAAHKYGFEIGEIIQAPIDGLVANCG